MFILRTGFLFSRQSDWLPLVLPAGPNPPTFEQVLQIRVVPIKHTMTWRSDSKKRNFILRLRQTERGYRFHPFISYKKKPSSSVLLYPSMPFLSFLCSSTLLLAITSASFVPSGAGTSVLNSVILIPQPCQWEELTPFTEHQFSKVFFCRIILLLSI